MPGLLDKLAGRRKSPRYKQPRLKVRVNGRSYRTVDWSLGGVRLENYDAGAARRERIEGKIKIPGGPSGDFLGEVIWTNEAGEAGVHFIEIAPEVFVELMTLQHS